MRQLWENGESSGNCYLNLLNDDNLTPDEALLFCLWIVMFLWHCITGLLSTASVPSPQFARSPLGGEDCLDPGPVLRGAAGVTCRTHCPTSETTRVHRLTQKLDLQSLSNLSWAPTARSEMLIKSKNMPYAGFGLFYKKKIGSRDIALLHSWNHWQMESSPVGLASWDPWLWDMIVAVCCQSHNSCGIVSLFAHHTSKKYILILLILPPYSPQSPFLWRCVLICPSRFEQEEFSDTFTVFSKVPILEASCPH